MIFFAMLSQPKKAIKYFTLAVLFGSTSIIVTSALIRYVQRFIKVPKNMEVREQLSAILEQEYLILGLLFLIYGVILFVYYLFFRKIKEAMWYPIMPVALFLACYFLIMVFFSLEVPVDRIEALTQDIKMIETDNLVEEDRYFTSSYSSKIQRTYLSGLHHYFKHINAITLTEYGAGRLEVFEGNNPDITRLIKRVENGEVVGAVVKYTPRMKVIVEVVKFEDEN